MNGTTKIIYILTVELENFFFLICSKTGAHHPQPSLTDYGLPLLLHTPCFRPMKAHFPPYTTSILSILCLPLTLLNVQANTPKLPLICAAAYALHIIIVIMIPSLHPSPRSLHFLRKNLFPFDFKESSNDQ